MADLPGFLKPGWWWTLLRAAIGSDAFLFFGGLGMLFAGLTGIHSVWLALTVVGGLTTLTAVGIGFISAQAKAHR